MHLFKSTLLKMGHHNGEVIRHQLDRIMCNSPSIVKGKYSVQVRTSRLRMSKAIGIIVQSTMARSVSACSAITSFSFYTTIMLMKEASCWAARHGSVESCFRKHGNFGKLRFYLNEE